MNFIKSMLLYCNRSVLISSPVLILNLSIKNTPTIISVAGAFFTLHITLKSAYLALDNPHSFTITFLSNRLKPSNYDHDTIHFRYIRNLLFLLGYTTNHYCFLQFHNIQNLLFHSEYTTSQVHFSLHCCS